MIRASSDNSPLNFDVNKLLLSDDFPILESPRLRLIPAPKCPPQFYDYVSNLLAIPKVGEGLWGKRKVFEPQHSPDSSHSTNQNQPPPPPRRRSTGCGHVLSQEQQEGFERDANEHFRMHNYGVWAVELVEELHPISHYEINGVKVLPRRQRWQSNDLGVTELENLRLSSSEQSSSAIDIETSSVSASAGDIDPSPISSFSSNLEDSGSSLPSLPRRQVIDAPEIQGLYGKYIGLVEVRHFPSENLKSSPVQSLGAWISPKYQNDGYGFEAAKRVLMFCFSNSSGSGGQRQRTLSGTFYNQPGVPTLKPDPLKEVYVAVLPDRPAVSRICEKLGMHVEVPEYGFAETDAWLEAMSVEYDEILEEDYKNRLNAYEQQQKQEGGETQGISLPRPRKLQTEDIATPKLTYWTITREDFLDRWEG